MERLHFDKIISLKDNLIATIGMFDGVHMGHQHFLSDLNKRAAEISCKSAVITFLNHPRQVIYGENEGLKLLQTAEERLNKIEKCGVDYIITMKFTKSLSQLSSNEFIDLLKTKLNIKSLMLGYDNRFGHREKVAFRENKVALHENNVLLRGDKVALYRDNLTEYFNGKKVSSTQIRKALLLGNISLANGMLGEEYSIEGVVAYGRQNGRKIDFPTANIIPDDCKLIPMDGVYATETEIEDTQGQNVGKRYKSVTNIGFNPTFSASERTIETFLLNFNENIYGKTLRIYFNNFIRHDKKFADILQLKDQITKDVSDAKKILG